MSFNFTNLFATVASIGAKAQTVATKAIAYIETIETVGAQAGLSGVQKLAAVKDALLADIGRTDAALGNAIASDWNAVAGAISGVVSIYNAAKLFETVVAPVVEGIIPASVPAFKAIEAGERVIDNVIGGATNPQPEPAV